MNNFPPDLSLALRQIPDRVCVPAGGRNKAGGKGKVINKDTKKRRPASGPPPHHTPCRGFDAKPGINPGESYSFTFTEVKTCPMHDHLNPTQFGKIIVE